MKYYINGSEVAEDRFDREANDNFNLSIPFEITRKEATTHMVYDEGSY